MSKKTEFETLFKEKTGIKLEGFKNDPKGFALILNDNPELIVSFREAIDEVRSPEAIAVAGLGNLFKGFD